MKAKETDIQNAIMQWLRAHKIRVERMNSGAMTSNVPGQKKRFFRFGFVGMPDLLVFLKDGSGRVLFIEVKSEKGRLSEAQKSFEQQCKDLLIPHLVARSIDDVSEYFKHVIGVP